MSTKEQRDEWRKLRGCGMTSAVGEYTPDEFWELLDDVDQLEQELAEAQKQLASYRKADADINEALNTGNGSYRP